MQALMLISPLSGTQVAEPRLGEPPEAEGTEADFAALIPPEVAVPVVEVFLPPPAPQVMVAQAMVAVPVSDAVATDDAMPLVGMPAPEAEVVVPAQGVVPAAQDTGTEAAVMAVVESLVPVDHPTAGKAQVSEPAVEVAPTGGRAEIAASKPEVTVVRGESLPVAGEGAPAGEGATRRVEPVGPTQSVVEFSAPLVLPSGKGETTDPARSEMIFPAAPGLVMPEGRGEAGDVKTLPTAAALPVIPAVAQSPVVPAVPMVMMPRVEGRARVESVEVQVLVVEGPEAMPEKELVPVPVSNAPPTPPAVVQVDLAAPVKVFAAGSPEVPVLVSTGLLLRFETDVGSRRAGRVEVAEGALPLASGPPKMVPERVLEIKLPSLPEAILDQPEAKAEFDLVPLALYSHGGGGVTAHSMPVSDKMIAASLPQLAAQVVDSLTRAPDGPTVLTLSPEELGRVTVSLQADGRDLDRMVVVMNFDRPETLDLFRRHVDQLTDALKAAGYAEVQIGFGSAGAGGTDRRSDEATPADDLAAPASVDAPAPLAPAPRLAGLGTLDLRL